MKIKRLVIHNIASYEDADINFNQPPLGNTDVFLISGITGSGKSTILDAICIALFGKTPRIDESDTTSVINRHEGMTLTDPRRLLRRNTGEGYVELYFEASGIDFMAHWGVKRARNKVTGALQKRDWYLTNLNTNHSIYLEKEIQERIDELVGVDYDQFCRTTMLSQGEFDKFLKCRESEKAEILQKITGADIYQRIGQQIFARTSQLKSEYQKLQDKLDSSSVMSDEEIAAIKQQIIDIDEKLKAISKEITGHAVTKTWLETRDANALQVAKLKEALDNAENETKTDDFRAAQADINQYDATGDVRNAMRQIAEQREAINNANKVKANQRERYASLLADVAALDAAAQLSKEQLNQANEALAAEAVRKPIYDAAGEICTWLRKAVDDENSAKANQKSSDALKKQLGEIGKQLVDLEQQQKSAQTALNDSQKAFDEQQKHLDELDVASLRRAKDNLQTLLHNIDNAVNALKLYSANEKAEQKLAKDIISAEDKAGELAIRLEKAKADLQTKSEVLRIAEDTRNKQRAAAGESAAVLRQGLKQGDICPVCGQKVQDVLPIADILEEMLLTADNAYHSANDAFVQATSEVAGVESEIKLNAALIAKSREQQPQLQQAAEQSLNAAKEACNSCKQQYVGVDKTIGQLVMTKTLTDVDFKKLTEQIKKIDILQSEHDANRKVLDVQKKAVETFANRLNDLRLQEADVKSEADKLAALATQLQTSAAQLRNDALEALGTSVAWDNDPVAATAKFVKELTDKKNGYMVLADKIAMLTTALQTKSMHAENAHKAAARVASLVSEWSGIEPTVALGVADVAEALNTVAAEVKSAADSIIASTEKLQVAQSKLNDFTTANPDVNIERLSHLASLSDDDVKQLRKKIAELNDAVVLCRGAYDQAMQQQATHLLTKPDALYESPDITINEISEAIDELEQSRNDLTSQAGACNEKLKANDAELAKRKADQEACNAAKKVYDSWQQINELFGDKEGKKFRTIALSYVLNNLIRSANQYMSHLTDRYTLSVQPGTFIILVTDAYQGYTTRTANTISGGETFLVSLALALALSDLGSVSGIDILFIDEGFGSLSGEPLQKAIETLRILHSTNRRVGIISHVAELRERIPVQIQVTQSDRTAASAIKIVP